MPHGWRSTLKAVASIGHGSMCIDVRAHRLCTWASVRQQRHLGCLGLSVGKHTSRCWPCIHAEWRLCEQARAQLGSALVGGGKGVPQAFAHLQGNARDGMLAQDIQQLSSPVDVTMHTLVQKSSKSHKHLTSQPQMQAAASAACCEAYDAGSGYWKQAARV